MVTTLEADDADDFDDLDDDDGDDFDEFEGLKEADVFSSKGSSARERIFEEVTREAEAEVTAEGRRKNAGDEEDEEEE